jgi:hypothetical protein
MNTIKTQDPKYGIKDNRLVNIKSGKAIPEGEPVFILRAKDSHALSAISRYMDLCHDVKHVDVVHQRFNEFLDFSNDYPNLMSEPDT